ncbi:glycerol kinase [Microvirga sp. RSM25]|uniref:FGGY-family carbohydrate kinase n=1 Tax=Microvirga sp. RSM25 TaxID=3273802 RepID=UPI00384B6C19
MTRIAAIDQGTTSTRVLLIEEDGTAQLRHAVRHEQHYPRPGWVEHNPLEILKNIRECIEAAGEVQAIGLDNQGESCLAWDGITGEPLTPIIVWQDNRTSERIASLRAEGAEQLTLSRAGLPLDAYFSASKLGWIMQNIDAARQALKAGRLRLGTTDAFFLDRLTGCYVTDVTTASRTSLMNIASGTWDPELCELFGVPVEALPEIRPTTGAIGFIGRALLTASVVDQQAALFGHGCRRPGEAKITFGTGAFALVLTGPDIIRKPDQGLLPTVAWNVGGQTQFALDGGVYNAGSAVEWGMRIGLLNQVSELAEFASPPAISRGLAFVPALSGLACPHWDRSASALWIGMSTETTRSDMCQALLEGIALRTAEVIAAMDEHIEISEAISIDGGLTRSAYFVQFLADCLARPLVIPSSDELTALGCAELASLGFGCGTVRRAGDVTCVEPRIGKPEVWLETFAEAVARTRKWR